MNPLNTVKGHHHRLRSSLCCWRSASDRTISSPRAPAFRASPAGCTSSPASSGSACCTTSTWCRCRAWPRRPPTRAVPAAPASTSTSRRARCCGSAGRRSRPGSPASGTSGDKFIAAFTLGHLGQDSYGAGHRHRRLARHDHAVQRLGADLAEPEEDPRHRGGDAMRKRRRPARSRCWPRARTSCCRSRC